MTTAIDHITQQINADKARRLTAYWQLARALANNEDGPEDAASVVLDAGKTTDDLARDVAVVRERIGLAQIAADADALDAEETKLAKAWADADAKLEKAQATRDAIVEPAEARIQQIARERRDATVALDKLAGNCPYPDVVAAHRDATAATREASGEAERLRHQLGRDKQVLDGMAEADGGYRSAKSNAEADTKRLTELDTRLVELRQVEDYTRKALLIP